MGPYTSAVVTYRAQATSYTSPIAASFVVPTAYFAKNVGGTVVPIQPALIVAGAPVTVSPAHAP